jgi:uncharacterized membrane protein
MGNIFDWLDYLWREHRGKLIGVILGLLFGIVTATWGFGKALFIAVCAVAGFLIGRLLDRGQSWQEIWKKISGNRW